MFLLFGPMLNFEELALPIAIATLLLVVEQRDGTGANREWAFAIGVLGALVSWEGILLGLAVAVWGELARRDQPLPRSRTRWLATGVLVGTASTVSWLVWANGSLGETWSTIRMRSSTTTAGVATQVDVQLSYVRINFSPWWLALAAIGCGALLLERHRRRPSHALLVIVPLLYLLALPNGAYFHPYWNYWLVLTVAVFAAVGAERLVASSRIRAAALAPLALVLLVAAPHVDQSPIRRDIASGVTAAELVRENSSADGAVWVWPKFLEPSWWATYYSGQPYVALNTNDLDRYAADDADHPVIVWRTEAVRVDGEATFEALKSVADVQRDDYLVVRAERLADVVIQR
jgi:hypothetical protein